MLTKEKCVELGVMEWVKKPIPAYAVQLVPDNDKVLAYDPRVDLTSQTVRTLEGVFHFDLSDYLVIGNNDEVWTVKQAIFEATYEQV